MVYSQILWSSVTKRGHKMKILYVLDFFYPYVGGVPTLFNNITKQMARNDHDVTVVTAHVAKTKNFEKYNGIKIYRFGKNREQFLLQSLHRLMTIRKKFDLVIAKDLLHHCKNPQKTFNRLMKFGKEIIIIEANKNNYWLSMYPKEEHPHFSLEEIKKL